MSDPIEIWLQPKSCADPAYGRTWCEDPNPDDCDEPWTKYVRHDSIAVALLELPHHEVLQLFMDVLKFKFESHIRNINNEVEAKPGKPGFYVPVTPAGSVLMHLESPTEELAWERLMIEGAHMPYETKQDWIDRGYTVEQETELENEDR